MARLAVLLVRKLHQILAEDDSPKSEGNCCLIELCAFRGKFHASSASCAAESFLWLAEGSRSRPARVPNRRVEDGRSGLRCARVFPALAASLVLRALRGRRSWKLSCLEFRRGCALTPGDGHLESEGHLAGRTVDGFGSVTLSLVLRREGVCGGRRSGRSGGRCVRRRGTTSSECLPSSCRIARFHRTGTRRRRAS
jgi:hypothetical protein